jgi:endonuclease/exonuclease/phosphatase (EEP) superfamily protein YafD
MRDFLSVAICVIVSLALFAIGIRYASGFWLFSTVHSLQIHLSIACILALLFAFVLSRRILPLGLISVSVLFLGHGLWMTWDLAQTGVPKSDDQPTFRLMSINVLMDNFENTETIRDAILQSGADVVNVMEAAPLRSELAWLSEVYPHRIGCGTMTEECDLMMLSKTPLYGSMIVTLSNVFEERMMLARVSFGDNPIHVAAIHTTKPYFDAFQSVELTRAARVLTRVKGPLLLSGDFNASSLAPNVRQFLRRTGLRTAGWEPPTWPDWAGWLGVPIDHVYVREPLQIRSLQRLPDPMGSNHYGLMADIVINGQ